MANERDQATIELPKDSMAGRTDTVSFTHRLLASENFMLLFREGMSLVEATAAYLDGEGRADSRFLDRPVALAYASESMRLTTRLMQLTSWLLLQRAVNEGEFRGRRPSASIAAWSSLRRNPRPTARFSPRCPTR